MSSIQKITFKNKNGFELSALLEVPLNQQPKAYALFAHCFTCNKNFNAVKQVVKALTRDGFAVLSFDFTGLGQSDGDFSDTNFSSNVDDLIAAAEFLEEQFKAPKLLVGHSLGGAAVLVASDLISSVQAVATIGAPSSPNHVQNLFETNLQEIEKAGIAKVSIGGRPFTIKKQFLDDINSAKLAERLSHFKKPLLVLHSPQDSTVSIENAKEIYEFAKHPKSFISLDGADHLLTNKADATYVGSVIASWADRYLTIPEKEEPKLLKEVLVRIENEEYTTEITNGKHTIVADEPANLGGSDLGQTPYDLLLASLGSCTAITLRMYANRKKWPLEEVKVHLSHSREHSVDGKATAEKKEQIDKIERLIELKGNLDKTQRARLLEIADKCPVHNTLHSPTEIKTELIK